MKSVLLTGDESLNPTLAGGKAASLTRLQSAGFKVPPFLVVSAMIPQEGNPPQALSDSQAAEIKEAVQKTFTRDCFLAVRSSATDEDGKAHSFAGMHDSFLFVRGEDALLEAIQNVRDSAYNDRALAYRKEHDLPVEQIAVAVIIQEMVDAAVSGVMFSVNPVNEKLDEVVISAVYGAGEGLVSAGLPADMFTVHKPSQEISSELVDKEEALRCDTVKGGLQRCDVEEALRSRPSLSNAQLKELAAAACGIEKEYRCPQDIEFSFDATGTLYILQSRPVTTVESLGPAAGNHLIWDNSNIIESYSGVTSPMTFSFIRRAYEIVYYCFTDVMGIPPKVVKANNEMFQNMLGLFHGQVYYNLLNWYRLVRLFPGFNYNKTFMESMMGVKEPVELQSENKPVGFFRKYFVELPDLLRLLCRSCWNFARIRKLTERFESNFKQHHDRWAAMDFDRQTPPELMAVYRDMEKHVLWNWKAPIINDFYVMIFYGILKKLCVTWCHDESGSLQNDLICGEGDIESTKPTRMLLHMAATAQSVPALRDLILNHPAGEVASRIHTDAEFSDFRAEVDAYLDEYGFRCMNELKLEEPSLRDRPDFLFTVLANYLKLDRPELLDVSRIEEREQTIRKTAEATVNANVKSWRRPLFEQVLRNARLGVKNRENMRFARTRIYGLLRELLRSMGRHFQKEGILEEGDDIFYLTLDECWDFIKGTAVTTRLSGIVALRKAEFDDYRAGEMPDDRFDTYGMAYHRNSFKDQSEPEPISEDGVLKGIGCCPGEVTGPVKVLRSPQDDMQLNGEILVAERTDPGWVPLYPSVSAVLIERGSILSHSAIVAREMGVPTIVGIPGLTQHIQTGDVVSMNGAAGTVKLPDEGNRAQED